MRAVLRKIPIVHPFLFALLPIFSLYRANMNLHGFPFNVIYLPAVILIAFTALSFGALSLVLRNKEKAALLISWFLLLFFAYGHLRDFAKTAVELYVPQVVDVFLGLIFIGGVLAILKIRRPLTLPVFVVSLVLLVVPVSRITIHFLRLSGTTIDDPAPRQSHPSSGELPDIYYIIFDGYGRQDALKALYDYDNSAQIEYLRERGFYVAEQSHSNYTQTAQSLASSLNLRYIDTAWIDFDINSRDRAPLARLIKNNDVQRLLRSVGYTSIALPSTYYPTEITNADVYFKPEIGFFTPDEFAEKLLETTPLPIAPRYSAYRQTILYSIDQLCNLPPCSTPRFVFAHLMVPHPPFIFGPEGGNRYPERRVWKRSDKEYSRLIGEMVTFSNRVMQRIVDSIFARSVRPPIIVIQADHGVPPKVNWEGLPNTNLRGTFSILNAYYLPDGGDSLLYPSITPVNTFRLILDYYFQTRFKRLSDWCYFSGSHQPYRFHDVTKELSVIRLSRDQLYDFSTDRQSE